MEEICMETWDRREHFEFFLRNDLPFYNVNFNADITGLREYAKGASVSLSAALIYLVTKSLNRVPNFLYRVLGGKVVRYERLHPQFTCLRGDEELFRLITVEFCDDLAEFDRSVKRAIEESDAYFNVGMLAHRSDFVFISSLPWIPFTGIDHTLSLNKEDAIPRVSWGRFFEQGGRTLLPCNIRVNHIFIDGLHVGRFYETFQEETRRLADSSAR